jgi:Glycosyl transferase family 2
VRNLHIPASRAIAALETRLGSTAKAAKPDKGTFDAGRDVDMIAGGQRLAIAKAFGWLPNQWHVILTMWRRLLGLPPIRDQGNAHALAGTMRPRRQATNAAQGRESGAETLAEGRRLDQGGSPHVELTILMPCLNEVETIEDCVTKAKLFLTRSGVDGEVLVADNGSTDGSQERARRLGARVVQVEQRGYGAAVAGGLRAAAGRFVIMGDADDSYDFTSIGPFLDELRAGSDLVMGNRFRGGIAPHAMPFLHRYLGNPVLSYLGRLFYRVLASTRSSRFQKTDVWTPPALQANSLTVRHEPVPSNRNNDASGGSLKGTKL